MRRIRGSRRLIVNLAVALVSGVIMIAALELLGRHVFLKGELYFVDDVDHRPTPGANDFNLDGIRCSREAESFSGDDFNIILLGDSFVEGLYLAEHETLSGQLEARARDAHPDRRVNVLNFGWLSASPLLSYRQLVDIGHKYSPDVVVQCVDMSDVHDDIKYEHFLRRDGVYRLLGVIPVTVLLARRILSPFESIQRSVFKLPGRRFFITDEPLERSEPYYETLRRNLERIDRHCREVLGCRFIVVVYPRGYQYSDRESLESWEAGEYEPLGRYSLEPFRYFEKMGREVAFPVHSLLPAFKASRLGPTCFSDDPHWNPYGAWIAARALHECLLADGCFE